MTHTDYIAALDQMYQEHYCGGICPYYDVCFASTEVNPKFKFDYAAKVGANYSNNSKVKVLVVGQEGKNGHTRTGKTEERIEQDNEHYRKTLYTLALILCKDTPKGFSKEALRPYEKLLKNFCLTNYYKCAIQKGNAYACRDLPHTQTMRANCYRILVKEIDILEPDIVIIQGKFTPESFWAAYENGKRIDGNKTEENDSISLYRYTHKNGKPFYVLYGYHPCYYQAWSGDLLDNFKKMIVKFLEMHN